MKVNHFIINYISVDDDEILVGATDTWRWKDENSTGHSGVDAKTHIWVTLENIIESEKSNWVIPEKVGLFCSRGDNLRKLAMSYVYELFEIAWDMKENKMNQKQAREKYFGFKLEEKNELAVNIGRD